MMHPASAAQGRFRIGFWFAFRSQSVAILATMEAEASIHGNVLSYTGWKGLVAAVFRHMALIDDPCQSV